MKQKTYCSQHAALFTMPVSKLLCSQEDFPDEHIGWKIVGFQIKPHPHDSELNILEMKVKPPDELIDDGPYLGE